MDFKVNREILAANEVIFDSVQEQSVELDCILPDYYPDIFRLIKCRLEPMIVSCSVSGDKLCYDLAVCIKILYCSEGSGAVNCVEQKMNYSKTVDLGKTVENPEIVLRPKTDYVNCRAVNQRRLDLRGAVSVKIRACHEQKQNIICDAYGMNVQLKKTPFEHASKKIFAEKRVTVTEEIDLGYSKPEVISIIRSDAVIPSFDKKIIANKVMVKGEAQVNLLYSCQKDGADSLEAMQFTVPFSQIMDMNGIDDRFESIADVTPISCEIIPKANADGENKLLECELMLLINCIAARNAIADIVTDAYSTTYPCECEFSNARIEKFPRQFCESHLSRASVEYKDGNIERIYDVWSKINNITSRILSDKGQIEIMGSVLYLVLAKNDQGVPVMLESEIPFEHVIDVGRVSPYSIFDAKAAVVSCSYNLVSTNVVELKSEIKITGMLREITEAKIVSEISVDGTKSKAREGDYALKLYFADEGEEVWDIAKKYSTSVNAIMEENELESEVLSQHGMILIPIVD